MEDNKLGKKIRVARKGKGISLQKLEEETGISYVNLSMLETGKTKKPTLNTLRAIMEVLPIDIRKEMKELGYTPVQIARISEIYEQSAKMSETSEHFEVVTTVSSTRDKIIVQEFLKQISTLSQKDKAIIEIILGIKADWPKL